jgi:hypothetical protein
LREGDKVCLAAGGSLDVIWIGCRWVDCRRHPNPDWALPVRIAPGAFGHDRPHRALFLSPEHAVYTNEVLIPIRLLVNGTTIRQVPVDSVTYYHVELRQHAILLSEGLATESYLETGGRCIFQNGGPCTTMHADMALLAWEANGCAPLVVTGPSCEAVREMLAEQARQLDEINRELPPATALHAAA